MKVSVIINTYSLDRFEDFTEATNAVLDQTYQDIELILVVDGNEDVYKQVVERFGEEPGIYTHLTDQNIGNSGARNAGAKLATGDIIAVTDDDAVPKPNWIEELVDIYQSTNAIAVGGPVTPIWVDGKPPFFPDEFLWLVGCNQPIFAEHMEEVRNTYGCNISFKRSVFEELGGFSEKVGRIADKPIQGHESEICIRMREEFGRGVVYTKEAVVNHKVYRYRTDVAWLIKRCFWQGVSKQIMSKLVEDATDTETKFLKQLITTYTPERLRSLISSPSRKKVFQLLTLYVFTLVVGLGYLYGLFVRRNIAGEQSEPEHSL